MNVLAWILFGLLAGGLAKFIMPGKDPGGCLITCAIGLIGALIGGFVTRLFGFGPVSGFNVHSLAVAILGSVVLLVLFRVIVSRKLEAKAKERGDGV